MSVADQESFTGTVVVPSVEGVVKVCIGATAVGAAVSSVVEPSYLSQTCSPSASYLARNGSPSEKTVLLARSPNVVPVT